MKNSNIRILSFDPGITNCGWAVVDYDVSTGKIDVPYHGTLKNNLVFKKHKELKGKFNKSFITLNAYYHEFVEMMQTYQPHDVAIEFAFMHKFPTAYLSLGLVIHEIRRASFTVFCRDVHLISPMQAKKEVTGVGGAEKNDMRSNLFSMTDVLVHGENPKEEMTEHAVDAAGIGVTFLKQVAIPNLDRLS